MLFWILLIISGLFAWLGVKKGFYAMFATLFCLMFAIYIGVLASPRIIRLSEGLENDSYYAAGCVFGTTLLVFLLLWIVAYFYFLRDCDDYFPKMFERIGGGVCGFLFGYILTSLVMLLVCIMPFSRNEGLPGFLQREAVSRFSVPAVVKTCNFIAEYSLECFDGDAEGTVEFLLSLDDKPEQAAPPAALPGNRLRL
jgi:uncharacterized membrane protein required for colicin V production